VKNNYIVAGALVLGMLSISANFSSTEILYENSSESPLLALLQSATQSIDIEIYQMEDQHVNQAVHDAVARGVKVRIIHEPSPEGAACRVFQAASSNDSDACTAQKALVDFVNQNGGQYVPFSKTLCGKPGGKCLEHGKMLVIDAQTALVSTGNYDPTSLCDHSENPKTCDRDYSVVSHDATVVHTLETIFENDLGGSSDPVQSVLDENQNTKLTVGPVTMAPIVNFIASAQTSLQIETQYLKDPTMNQAILDAAQRGVQVSLMVASACSFAKPKGSAVTKWTNTYTAFESAGASVRIFTKKMKVGGEGGYLHAKAMIADGTRAWVGSTNGSTQAITDNREFGLFSSDATLVGKLNGLLSTDFANTDGETWQESLDCAHD
jgi:cardiolipin synthase